MKKILIAAVLFLIASATAQAQSKLPDFSLLDPQGGSHSSAELLGKGLVVLVTAPTLHEKDAQVGWIKLLIAAKGSNKGNFVLIEDITASAFKGIARGDMKKDWKPGDIPLLLIDETGKTREAFGMAKDTTKVFVYDKGGNLIYSESSPPSAALAKSVWDKLRGT